MSPAHLLEVKDLRCSFLTPRGEIKAVDGVSFEVRRGEMMCMRSLTTTLLAS